MQKYEEMKPAAKSSENAKAQGATQTMLKAALAQ